MTNREIVGFVIDHFEGHEFTDRDPADDPGGATKFGVSLRAYKLFFPRATAQDIKDLTFEDAVQFMMQTHLLEPGYDLIRDARLRLAVVDFAIHSGPGRATRYLQLAAGTDDDGVLGPLTLAAVNDSGVSPDLLASKVTGRRLGYLTNLRNWHANSRGWARRMAVLIDTITRPQTT